VSVFLVGYIFTPWEVAQIDTFSSLLYTEKFRKVEERLRYLEGRMDPLILGVMRLAYYQLYMSDNNTERYYDEFVSLMDELRGRYAKPKSTREKMLLATVYAMGAVLYGRRRSIPKALDFGRRAFNLYREAYGEDTTVYDALLPMGLYDYAIGYLTRSKGRKREGIRKVKVVMERGSLAKPLAYAGLVYIFVFDNKPGRAVSYGLKALHMYPESRTFRWILGQAYLKAAMYEKALNTYREIEGDLRRRNPSCKVCIAEALYYQGESLEGMGRRKEAKSTWWRALYYLKRERDPHRRRKVEELRKRLAKRGVR